MMPGPVLGGHVKSRQLVVPPKSAILLSPRIATSRMLLWRKGVGKIRPLSRNNLVSDQRYAPTEPPSKTSGQPYPKSRFCSNCSLEFKSRVEFTKPYAQRPRIDLRLVEAPQDHL